MSKELTEQRMALAEAERNSYSPDYFPGSAKWRLNRQARAALDAFDAAHPEIKAEIEAATAREQAQTDAYWTSPAGVEKALGM